MISRPDPPLLKRLLSPAYGLGSGVFHWLHDHGVVREKHLPVRVLSVGNLVVGGTGKTPTVIALARSALEVGLHPAILTRGYGGQRRGVLRAGAWSHGPVDVMDTGDEPLLMSRSLPEVPVVIDSNRHRGGSQLMRSDPGIDLFILDDGFQHRKLARHSSLVLLDEEQPLGNGWMLPAGPLREPPTALRRADAILLTGSDPNRDIPPGTARSIREYAASARVYRSWVVPSGLTRGFHRSVSVPLAELQGRRVLATAGIARADRFRSSLEALGAVVSEWEPFRDHHLFSSREVAGLEERARRGDLWLMTTTKDATRLGGVADPRSSWHVLSVEPDVEGGWGKLLTHLLKRAPAAKK